MSVRSTAPKVLFSQWKVIEEVRYPWFILALVLSADDKRFLDLAGSWPYKLHVQFYTGHEIACATIKTITFIHSSMVAPTTVKSNRNGMLPMFGRVFVVVFRRH